MEDFTQALALMPPSKRVEVLANRAYCYLKLEKLDLALADYTAVIDAGARKETSYYDRAVVRLKLNDKAGAISDMEGALRINPNFELAKNALAQLRNSQ